MSDINPYKELQFIVERMFERNVHSGTYQIVSQYSITNGIVPQVLEPAAFHKDAIREMFGTLDVYYQFQAVCGQAQNTAHAQWCWFNTLANRQFRYTKKLSAALAVAYGMTVGLLWYTNLHGRLPTDLKSFMDTYLEHDLDTAVVA